MLWPARAARRALTPRKIKLRNVLDPETRPWRGST